MSFPTITSATAEQLRRTVEDIVDQLAALVYGDLLETPSGEYVFRDDLDERDDISEDECTDVDLFEWINDQLSLTIKGSKTPGGDWDVDGVEVWITCGGPNIWVSTVSGEDGVHGAWGSDRVSRSLPPDAADMLDELADH